MGKLNLVLPLKFRADDTLLLCDGSWCLLFERFFIRYRLAIKETYDVAKIKVISTSKDIYRFRLMEVTPENGRVIVPVSSDAVQDHDLYRVHLAMALSHNRIKLHRKRLAE